jgi:hypothetical protein
VLEESVRLLYYAHARCFVRSDLVSFAVCFSVCGQQRRNIISIDDSPANDDSDIFFYVECENVPTSRAAVVEQKTFTLIDLFVMIATPERNVGRPTLILLAIFTRPYKKC